MDTTRIDYSGRNWWWALERLAAPQQHRFIVHAYQSGWISDWQLWEALSHASSRVAYPVARAIYTALGFVPFNGYPLTPMKED